MRFAHESLLVYYQFSSANYSTVHLVSKVNAERLYGDYFTV
jgi:hypothetical protein